MDLRIVYLSFCHVPPPLAIMEDSKLMESRRRLQAREWVQRCRRRLTFQQWEETTCASAPDQGNALHLTAQLSVWWWMSNPTHILKAHDTISTALCHFVQSTTFHVLCVRHMNRCTCIYLVSNILRTASIATTFTLHTLYLWHHTNPAVYLEQCHRTESHLDGAECQGFWPRWVHICLQ